MKVGNGLPMLLTKHLNKEFLKFLISGGINTLATYLMYLLLLHFYNYSISYSISYVAGIFLSYYLNSVFVFKEKISFRKFLKFPLVYIVQYLVNMLMMYILVEFAQMLAQIVPLVAMVVTVPITFLLSKMIIKSK
ncbi:membrane protein [Paenibacillus silvae]|uniref:Membrane protein n=1 Tax=Paenibacillus silvae TaxID=1325358 RepID=A0ABQ1ZG26_9BACL|nr:GtrA family protein [Paenibacillus silvae]GGH64005.1 membrane protein [Paenibacillus silvae]